MGAYGRGGAEERAQRKDERKEKVIRQRITDQIRDHRGALEQSFLITDATGSGVLSVEDFRKCLRASGVHLADADCCSVLPGKGQSADGKVNYVEFLSEVAANMSPSRLQQHQSRSTTSSIIPHAERGVGQRSAGSSETKEESDGGWGEGVHHKEDRLFRARLRQRLVSGADRLKVTIDTVHYVN